MSRIDMTYRRVVCGYLRKSGILNPWGMSDLKRIKACEVRLGIGPLSIKTKEWRREALGTLAAEIQRRKNEAHKKLPNFSKEQKEAGPPSQKMIRDFYDSPQWKRLSYRAKITLGRRCMVCGKTPEDGIVIHTDHIKPIRHHWALRLDPNNLQILCEECNLGKGSWDETDFRRASAVACAETGSATVLKLVR